MAKIMKPHTAFEDQFVELVDGTKGSLRTLVPVVIDALYCDLTSNGYRPAGDVEWDDIQAAIEDGQAKWDEDEKRILPDVKDATVRRARNAVKALADRLEESPDGFHEWYVDKYDAEPELARRPFWGRHFE